MPERNCLCMHGCVRCVSVEVHVCQCACVQGCCPSPIAALTHLHLLFPQYRKGWAQGLLLHQSQCLNNPFVCFFPGASLEGYLLPSLGTRVLILYCLQIKPRPHCLSFEALHSQPMPSPASLTREWPVCQSHWTVYYFLDNAHLTGPLL